MNYELGILYSFTSEAGDGYCVQRTMPNNSPVLMHSSNAVWYYLDKNFGPNVEFIHTKRIMEEKAKLNNRYPQNMSSFLNIKRELVKDLSVLAKFALLEGHLSAKTQVLITLDNLREKINGQDCNLAKIQSTLETLL